MSGTKYELTDIVHPGDARLRRIRALLDIPGVVEAGELGGWVLGEHSLAQDGDCWIGDEAIVTDHARVVGDAWVVGHAWVGDRAQVGGHARVGDRAQVGGHAQVRGHAQVGDRAQVGGHAWVGDHARVSGDADISRPEHVLCLVPAGPYASATLHRTAGGGHEIAIGCQRLTADQLVGAAEKEHPDDPAIAAMAAAFAGLCETVIASWSTVEVAA